MLLLTRSTAKVWDSKHTGNVGLMNPVLADQLPGVLRHPSAYTCGSWCCTDSLSESTRRVFLQPPWPGSWSHAEAAECSPGTALVALCVPAGARSLGSILLSSGRSLAAALAAEGPQSLGREFPVCPVRDVPLCVDYSGLVDHRAGKKLLF